VLVRSRDFVSTASAPASLEGEPVASAAA